MPYIIYMPRDVRGSKQEIEMSKLQTVKIKAGTDCYGQTYFDIVTVQGGYMERSNIGSYEVAREIATNIDARNIYERSHGADSLATI